MGYSDEVVILDGARLSCPQGHVVRSFQTKDFEHPALATYLVHGGRMFLAVDSEPLSDADVEVGWRAVGNVAIREHRYALREITLPRIVRVFGYCPRCEPVLVRAEGALFGDLVIEHSLLVDYVLELRPGEPLLAQRESGTRDELRGDLRRRGLHVLDDDEPLAVSHRKRAREQRARRVKGKG